MDKLIGEFDARVWAEEFVKTVKEKPEIATDGGTMITWFANAIMSGYDKGKAELQKKEASVKEISEVITGIVSQHFLYIKEIARALKDKFDVRVR